MQQQCTRYDDQISVLVKTVHAENFYRDTFVGEIRLISYDGFAPPGDFIMAESWDEVSDMSRRYAPPSWKQSPVLYSANIPVDETFIMHINLVNRVAWRNHGKRTQTHTILRKCNYTYVIIKGLGTRGGPSPCPSPLSYVTAHRPGVEGRRYCMLCRSAQG